MESEVKRSKVGTRLLTAGEGLYVDATAFSAEVRFPVLLHVSAKFYRQLSATISHVCFALHGDEKYVMTRRSLRWNVLCVGELWLHNHHGT